MHAVTLDVSDLEAVGRLADELPDEFQDVDILVNNAGDSLHTSLSCAKNHYKAAETLVCDQAWHLVRRRSMKTMYRSVPCNV